MGGSSAHLRIAIAGWEAMNRAVVGPEKQLLAFMFFFLFVGNDLLDYTHWALDLCQCRIDFNI